MKNATLHTIAGRETLRPQAAVSLVDFAIQLIIQDNPDIFPTPGLTPSTDPSQVIYRFEECEVVFNTPSVVIACQLSVCIRSTGAK